MGTEGDIERQVGALAARQHGVVSRRQLLALGLKAGAIGKRVRAGRLISLHRGVYAVGHAQLRPDGFWMAAALAGGPNAVLSRRSAAAAWGLRPRHGSFHELATSSTSGRRPRRDGDVRIRRCPGLRADEVTRLRAIPITTVARTLLDLAAILEPHELRRAVERGDQSEIFDLRRVTRVLAAHPGEPGTPALRALLKDFRHYGVTLTRSELEARMLQLCLDHGLPRPAVNHSRDGRELDFRWTAARLIVETDGWATHGTRTAFEADRARDRRLAVEGWRVVRTTHRQLRDEPHAIAADITRLLG